MGDGVELLDERARTRQALGQQTMAEETKTTEILGEEIEMVAFSRSHDPASSVYYSEPARFDSLVLTVDNHGKAGVWNFTKCV
jgi:hypothetical protein